MSEATQGGIEPWDIVSEECVADCRVFSVLRRHERRRDGACEGDFSVIKARDWVVVLASPAPEHLLMVGQFRFGTHEMSLEFPAGCLDEGEAPLDAAARELREETGYAPVGEGRILGMARPNPALQDNTCWFVHFDKVCSAGSPQWDEHEQIEVRTLPLATIRRMAVEGTVSHGLAHAALFMLEESAKAR